MSLHRRGTRGPAGAGPLRMFWGRLRGAAAILLPVLLAGACATSPTSAPAPGPGDREPDATPEGPGPAATPGPTDPGAARDALESVRRLVDAGRSADAAIVADSLYFRTRHLRDLAPVAADALDQEARALAAAGRLREAEGRLQELLHLFPDRAAGAPLRLAEIRLRLGDDPGSVRALLDFQAAVDDSARQILRRATRAMSVEELEGVLEVPGRRSGAAGERADGILLTELAVARARAGQGAAAREAARRALEADPRQPERARARDVLDGRIEGAPRPAVGLLFPGSGRFASVGAQLREGIELALDRHVASGGRRPRLLESDTGPEGADPADLARELRRRGAVAILGPVRSGDLERVVEAASAPGPAILSPTATRGLELPLHAFTLWERTRRELDAARAAGRWTGDVLPGVPVGAVYPDDPVGRRAFLMFRSGLFESRAWMAAASPFGSGATTLEDPISAVSAFGPRAVFAPGGSREAVLQMAPQLSYYGIRAALVAGGIQWADPATLRRLDPSFSQFRVVPALTDHTDPGSAWSAFKTAYEKKYRKSLFGNVLPALGHDAILLVLRALEDVHPARPRALARRIGTLEGVEGASGRLSPDPATGTVRREVLVRALEQRELTPVDGARVREWLSSASRLETARARTRRSRALEAVRESGIELSARGPGEEGER